MRRLLEDLTVRHMGLKLNISSWWHISIAIGRRYIDSGFGGPEGSYEGYDSDDEDLIVEDKAIDLQAGHSTFVAHMIYGREVQQGNTGVLVQQEEFRKISIRWHLFFAFGSKVNIYGCLKQMFKDPNARFKGNQLEAIKAVVRGATPILQVTSTGGGKSLTFMLLSYAMGNGTTIVIVPFIAIEEDLLKRYRMMNISCEIWSPMHAQTASIILVTPESFCTKGFAEFMSRLNMRQELDRIVLDECHTVLDASYKYRKSLRTIGDIMIPTGVQLVFLTATMPPRDEPEFWTTLGLTMSKAVVVRGTTSRPNIEYSVFTVEDSYEEQGQAIQFATEASSSFEGNTGCRTKVIIYCQRIDQANDVSEELGCPAYYSDVGNVVQKNEFVQQWVTLGGPIVAISALGTGVDISDVRLVLYIGLPRSLRDYVQESGRAGRDGVTACSRYTEVSLVKTDRKSGQGPML
ncbi:hypothetical protein OQA88_2404 [Cercophora sp. LCS_1]